MKPLVLGRFALLFCLAYGLLVLAGCDDEKPAPSPDKRNESPQMKEQRKSKSD